MLPALRSLGIANISITKKALYEFRLANASVVVGEH